MYMTIDWTAMFKTYKGLWVALNDDEKTVIASGNNPKDVKEKAYKKGYQSPILMKIPLKVTAQIG